MASGLIVTHHLSQQPHDQRELEPTLAQLTAQEAELGKAENLLADARGIAARATRRRV